MHDLRFSEVIWIKGWRALSERTYRYSCCARAAKKYVDGLLIMHSLAAIPGSAWLKAQLWEEATQSTSQNKPGIPKSSPDFKKETEVRFWALLQGLGYEDYRKHLYRSTESAILLNTPVYHSAYHLLLQAVLVQAWTAFEILAEDLWSRVLRQRPRLDTRTRKERSSSGFRSTQKIKNLYEFTFRANNGAIMRSVSSADVRALAVARNVIVHSGGRIDKTFLKDRRRLRGLRCIKGNRLGYEIPFTGPMVRRLVDPVTPKGFDLVRAVDRWLVKHR